MQLNTLVDNDEDQGLACLWLKTLSEVPLPPLRGWLFCSSKAQFLPAQMVYSHVPNHVQRHAIHTVLATSVTTPHYYCHFYRFCNSYVDFCDGSTLIIANCLVHLELTLKISQSIIPGVTSARSERESTTHVTTFPGRATLHAT